MEVHLQIEKLRNALGKVLSVVDKRNSRPILTYTFIQAEGEKIHLSATDMEVSAKVSLNAEVTTNGSFCVNAKNLFDILRELPNEKLTLKLDDNENTLKL